MQPILVRFQVGGWEVVLPAYGTFLVLAAVVAVTLAVRAAASPGVGLSRRRAVVLYAAAVAAGIVGARFLDVLLDWGAYAKDPSRLTSTALRGFALAGGFSGAVLAAVALARRWGVAPGTLADSAVTATAVGIVLIRIGCFLNGCCAGEVTTLPWGVTFPYGSDAWGQQLLSGQGGLLALAGRVEPVHPTQLYEAGAAVLCAALASLVRRRGAPPGTAALVFAAGFLAFRVLNQSIRPDAPGA
ncbi:MAG: prolipoprotein diacylglyceryl transferase, partial [Candidatus Limnocylindrales bacterium]